jgi:hypothetical protein
MAAAAQQQKALGELPPEEPSDACCWACSGGVRSYDCMQLTLASDWRVDSLFIPNKMLHT